MTFRLQKHDTGPTLTKFYVKDSTNAIVGTINVANSDAGDLQKHWLAPTTPAKSAAAKAEAGRKAFVAALKRGPRLSKEAVKQAILRAS